MPKKFFSMCAAHDARNTSVASFSNRTNATAKSSTSNFFGSHAFAEESLRALLRAGLAPGGRAGVIVPNGVLFGSTKAARKVRELLLTECDLQAVVNLPSGVFKPYSGVGTAALIFEKRSELIKRPEHPELVEGKKTKRPEPVEGRGLRQASTGSAQPAPQMQGAFVWFYDLTADGFSLDDKRTPIDANDIPDVLAKHPERVEGPNSYRVPLVKIFESDDLSLAAGRYKPVTVQAANHDKPQDILAEVLTLEDEIAQRARALMGTIEK